MESRLTSMEVAELRARWLNADGIGRRQQILEDRFNLGSISKIGEVAANESLSRDLRGIDLSNEHLFTFMLIEVDLSWARFTCAKINGPFRDALVAGCDFTASHIDHSTFWGCRGSNTIFDRADISRTMFEESALPGVSFAGAVLSQVQFLSSDLTGADFSGTNLRDCTFRKVRVDARWRRHLEDMHASLHAVEWE